MKSVAQTILAQILMAPYELIMTWGMKDSSAIGKEENSLGGLSFKVSGRLHKGHVKVCLQHNDLYTVKLYNRNLNIKEVVKDLDVESLVSNLGNMIDGNKAA